MNKINVQKRWIKTLTLIWSTLMPNTGCAIALTRDRENYSICRNSRLYVLTPPTAWRHSSRVVIGTAYYKLWNGYRAALYPATSIIKSRSSRPTRPNLFLWFQKCFSKFFMEFSMNVFKNKKRWQNKKNVKKRKNVTRIKNVKTFFTRDSIYAIARIMLSPVRLSVRPSVRHTGVS